MDATDDLKIPQADDVGRILDVPLAVIEGANSPKDLAKRYHFDLRQGLYYLQAAEMLGLVKRNGEKYRLSNEGRRYVALTPPQRKEMLSQKILSLPIISNLVRELIVSPIHRLSREQVETIVSSSSRISGSTIPRRVHTIFNWLTWLGEETRVLEASKDTVSLCPDIKSA